MFPFSKKKKDEEEEEEILEEDLPPKRKFRDLKSEHKKKRKEPVKPWGKMERILVLTVLGITVVASAVLSAVSRGEVSIPKLSLPSFSSGSSGNNSPEQKEGEFSLSGLFGGTFTFEKTSQDDCCQRVVMDFKNLTDDLTGDYGFYVVGVNSSRAYGLNENDSFTAASLLKLPVAITLYKEAEEGTINLDSIYTLQDSDKVGGNGVLFSSPAGSRFTYRKLVQYMLHESDNTAFNIFEKVLGARKIQDTILSLGMKQTSIYDDVTTPKDMAMTLKMIKSGELLNRGDADELLSFLEGTSFDSWLAAGVPGEVKIQHKYGKEAGAVEDAGIVYTKDPYVIVIMSKDVDEAEADSVFAKISKSVYDFETSN